MITAKHYGTLDKAFDYFNAHLFEGGLPDTIITMNRKKRVRGYFHHDKFQNRTSHEGLSEISLNPDEFLERDDLEILSTLVHEMTHLWQAIYGDAPRKGYHDKEFSRKMYSLGLQTSSTGEPDGKPIGQRMSHYILRAGQFEIVAKGFTLKEGKILIESLPDPEKEKKEKKKTRYKYTCPECGMAAWAKKSANIACGDCKESMIIEEEDNENG